jgi:hypothetical protein
VRLAIEGSSPILKTRAVIALVAVLAVAGLSACATPVPTATAVPRAASTPTATPSPAPTLTPTVGARSSGDGVVNGWAVLAEKDDYADVEMTDLPVDYTNIVTLHELLVDSGWEEGRIRELREFGGQDLPQALDWLAASADEDDVVLLYVAAHSRFLERVVDWDAFFGAEWAEISSQRRVLILDVCQAAIFIADVSDDPRPHLSVAAVGEREYGWSGLPEEGLPIIGGVFTHYFVEAFARTVADADESGAVSVQEAARYAETQQRSYMHEVVFAVPEFAAMYPEEASPVEDPAYPHVVVDDDIGEPVYLDLY